MSAALKVDVSGNALDAITRAEAQLRPERVLPVAGRAVRNLLVAHFVELNSSRHKWGSNFYAKAAKSTSFTVSGNTATVSVNQVGIAQRYFGGEITPKNGKWLTIPAREEAGGHRAREFNDLHFVQFSSTLAALVQNDQSRTGGRVRGSVTPSAGKGDAGGGIFFWLVTRVDQKADPSVLPTMQQIETTAAAAMQKAVSSPGGEAETNG